MPQSGRAMYGALLLLFIFMLLAVKMNNPWPKINIHPHTHPHTHPPTHAPLTPSSRAGLVSSSADFRGAPLPSSALLPSIRPPAEVSHVLLSSPPRSADPWSGWRRKAMLEGAGDRKKWKRQRG
ncbi:hypothetical protein E2C01_023978 [Portunus trituberculatus]|uniref:Uncharacterized protein n=1 Tax=Portunus trituberculatus TaxID=210409 RepID=A0A5B7EAP4_PORTR|nr:hypothetical protein [Portunus trituberculatus]